MYPDQSFFKPKVEPIILSSGRNTNIVTFSLKDAIVRLVNDKSIFCPDNLLLDPNNPFKDLSDTEYYGDVNTGTKKLSRMNVTYPITY